MTSLSDKIRQQYEDYPYPRRRPEDERARLIATVGDSLPAINHYGFNGERGFGPDFRALVAGGGTGDAAIYLAEQLLATGGGVTYLDLSDRSSEIAKARAKVRGLGNITWLRGDLLDLDAMALPPFDYINCSGVLHHLKDPEQGLAVLSRQLKPKGAIYLMLYGRHGRAALYPMQKVLRLLTDQDADLRAKISTARRVIADLPATNAFRRDLDAWRGEIDPDGGGDAGLVDLLLHEQDRAYDVDEALAFSRSCGLHFVNFVGPDKRNYEPERHLTDEAMLQRVSSTPREARWQVAELLYGRIAKHQFYLANRPNTEARLEDLSNAIVLCGPLAEKHAQLAEAIKPGTPTKIGISVDGELQEWVIAGTPSLRRLLGFFDGITPLRQAIDTCRQELPTVATETLLNEVRQVFELFHPVGCAYLRKGGASSTLKDGRGNGAA
jgi:SAM-dependent methyltransferase